MNLPPGYAGYDQHGGSGKRLSGLATAITVLVPIVVAVNVLASLLVVAFRSRFRDFLAGEVPESDAEDAAGAIIAVLGIAGVVQVAVAVCVMIWMFRAAQNLRTLGRVGATWSPGWAIGAWFLPPCIFVLPWLMLKELWKGSASTAAPNDPSWKRHPASPLVTVWWVVYGIVSVFLGGWQFRTGGFDQDFEDVAEAYVDAAPQAAMGAVVTIVSGVLFVMIVRGITKHQQSRLAV
jgi:Domain of unknown function (DUF4328)